MGARSGALRRAADCTYNVIEHFTHPEEMFAETRRVLKPGGVFCGACAFWEMEHDSFFHLSHLGLKQPLDRRGFELVSPTRSVYSGSVLVSRRFLGGAGRIDTGSRYSTLRCNLNRVPFLLTNALEFLRRMLSGPAYLPLRDCAALYFFAREAVRPPAGQMSPALHPPTTRTPGERLTALTERPKLGFRKQRMPAAPPRTRMSSEGW